MPIVIDITEAKPHYVNFLDRLIIEQGGIYVMDLGYMDFELSPYKYYSTV